MGQDPPSACRLTAADSLLSLLPMSTTGPSSCYCHKGHGVRERERGRLRRRHVIIEQTRDDEPFVQLYT